MRYFFQLGKSGASICFLELCIFESCCHYLTNQFTMPFTFSHPAIVLPIAKHSGRYLSLTGLIIGSMTPDFEYFFRMKIQSNFSHTIGGLFYFDLPVGILLSFLFHNFIRNMLYDNLPNTFRSRLEGFKTFDWNEYLKRHYFVVIISILIGAMSHLFWDSFTHIHGYSVQTFLILQRTFNLAGNQIPIYKLLQHLSSLLGGFFIVLAFFSLPKSTHILKAINLKYWFTVLIITMALISLKLIFGIDKSFFGQIFITSVDAIFVALIFTPTLMRQKARRKNTANVH
jgi:hypothetical protein